MNDPYSNDAAIVARTDTLIEVLWDKWLAMPTLTVGEAIALSINAEPACRHNDMWDDDRARLFRRRATTVARWIDLPTERGRLEITAPVMTDDERKDGTSVLDWFVNSADFFSLCVRVGWPVPNELRQHFAYPAGASSPTSEASYRWPWGDYDTKLLGVLAEAVREWWSTYDQDNPDTAPLQSEVTEWIEDRLTKLEYQNPGTLAGYMATIIRHEKAPVGRRKKSRTD